MWITFSCRAIDNLFLHLFPQMVTIHPSHFKRVLPTPVCYRGVFKTLRLHRLLYLNCRMCTNRTSPRMSKIRMLPSQPTFVFCRDNRTRTCTVISNTCSQNRTDTNYRLHPQFIVPPSGLEPRPEGLVLQTSCYIRIAFCRHNLILCSLPKVTMYQ